MEDVEMLTEKQITEDLTLKDGRIYFKSKESLGKIYKEYAEASDEKLSNFLDPIYKSGFYSLRPIATEKNEQFLKEHYSKILNNNEQYKGANSKSDEGMFDYLDELEDIIGDDTFAALLNADGEIQIGDEIYKYTDVGLFYSKVEKFDVLESYLNTKNISQDLTILTSDSARQAIVNEFPQGGIISVNNNVNYFKILPNDPESGGGGNTGSGSGTGGTGNNIPNSDPAFAAFSNNLQNCDQVSGVWNWISNIFGDNNVCIDKYEDRRRVKTKVFNYDYLAIYHMGVKCVHQFRGGTGLWRNEDTQEMRTIIQSAQFEYDTDRLLNNAIATLQSQQKVYFINNQKIVYNPNNLNITSVGGAVGFTYTGLNQTALPAIFQNEGAGLTFEIFGTGSTTIDNLIQNGIDSSLNASKVNTLFYNELYNQTTTILRTALNNSNYTLPETRTMLLKYPQAGKLIVQKNGSNRAYNTSTIQKTYDWGAEIRLTTSSIGSSEGWSDIAYGAGDQLLRPKNFRVKMIGAASNWGTWHGSKISVGID